MSDRWEMAARRLIAESLLSAAKAAAHVPSARTGKTSGRTVTRWIIAGKRGVFLDGVRATGRGWHTSLAALERFWAELSRADTTSIPSAVPAPTKAAAAAEARRQAEHEQVRRLLSQKRGKKS